LNGSISGDASTPVFVNSGKSAPIDQHNLAARVLKPAARKLGMPWVSWHSFRHANATLAEQAGISVVERQKILGHGSAAVTLHYTHADVERMRERMAAMVPADFGQQSPTEPQISSVTVH
jgi:integrase